MCIKDNAHMAVQEGVHTLGVILQWVQYII